MYYTVVYTTNVDMSTWCVATVDCQQVMGSGPIHLDDVKCEGEETNLLSCPQLAQNIQHNCKHSEDAGVKCQGVRIKCVYLSSKNGSQELEHCIFSTVE